MLDISSKMSEEKSILKPTIQITILSFIGIILNFITQLVIAFFWGTTPERDAYFAAIILPTYLSSILVGSIGIIFLPTYVDTKIKKSIQRANLFFSHTLGLIIIVSIIIIFLFSVFADNILSITTPGFRDEQLLLTSNLLIILLPIVLFQAVISIIGSVLQVQHRFIIPALSPIFISIISLLFVITFRRFWGIKALAYGVLAGNFIIVIFLLIHIRKSILLKLSENGNNSEIYKLLKVSAPLLIAGIFYRLTGVFERAIGSTLSAGSISYLGYANQIMTILATIISSGISITIYPILSTAWSEQNFERLQMLIKRGINIIFILSLPVSIVFICWGTPIFQILFERGAFTHESTLAVSQTFSILTIALIGKCLGEILAKFFYFSNKTFLLSCLEIISTLSYLLMGYFAVQLFSYKGLAMATSGSTVMSIIMSFVVVTLFVRNIELNKIFRNFIIIIFASVLPAICILFGMKIGHLNEEISIPLLFLIFLVYLISYFLFLKLFKVEELNYIYLEVKQQLKRK